MTYFQALNAIPAPVWWITLIGGIVCIPAGIAAYHGFKKSDNHAWQTHFCFGVVALVTLALIWGGTWGAFGGILFIAVPVITFMAMGAVGYGLGPIIEMIENKAVALMILALLILVAFFLMGGSFQAPGAITPPV